MSGKRDKQVLRRFERVVVLLEACATDPRYRRDHAIVNSIACYRCPARVQCCYAFDTYLVSFDFLAIVTMSTLKRCLGDLKRCKTGDAGLGEGWTWYMAGARLERARRSARAAAGAGSVSPRAGV